MRPLPAIKRPELRKRGAERLTPKNDVKAAATTMPAVGASNGGDSLSMTGVGEPVMDGGADSPALDRRVARARMAGDQQDHPLAVNKGIFQCPINGLPSPFEVMAVEVDNPVGLNRAGFQPPVPARIQRVGDGHRPWRRRCGRPRRRAFRLASDRRRPRPRWRDSRLRLRQRIAGQRPNRLGHLRPEGLLLRGQAAHRPPAPLPRCPWAGGSAPSHWRPCRPRCARTRHRRPRRCRSGWRP